MHGCGCYTILLDSHTVTRCARACARHGQYTSNMKAYGYAARTHSTVHVMALAGAPKQSGRPPRDERCARDSLGARACRDCHPLWPVLGAICRPRCTPAGRHHLAPRRLCSTSAPGLTTACGSFLLVLLCQPVGLLSLCPALPWRLACGRPDTPRSHAVERTAATDLSGVSWRARSKNPASRYQSLRFSLKTRGRAVP